MHINRGFPHVRRVAVHTLATKRGKSYNRHVPLPVGSKTQLDKCNTYAVVALDQPRRGENTLVGDEASQDAQFPGTDPALGLVLHYHVPEQLAGAVEPGQLVVVPLRASPSYGVIVELSSDAPVGDTRPITRLLDPRPVLSPAMLLLAGWIARYYRCTLWQAISPMLPPGVARRAITLVGLSPLAQAGDENHPLVSALGRRQSQVVSLLKEAPRSTLTLSKLKRDYTGATSGLNGVMRDLERKGLLTRQTQLPKPRSKPQHERIIRLAVSAERTDEAVSEASQRAPLQAAALAWLLKKRASLAGDRRKTTEGRSPQSQIEQSSEIHTPQSAIRNTEWFPLRELYFHTGATAATLTSLERKGLVELSQRSVHRDPVPATASSPRDEPPNLTPAQAEAWHEIAAALRLTGDRAETITGEPKQFPDNQTQNSKLKTQNFLPQLLQQIGLGDDPHQSPKQDAQKKPEDPTEKLAEKVSDGVFDQSIDKDTKKAVGQAIHWGYGTAWGAFYGIVQSSLRLPHLFHGTVFGGLLTLIASTLVPSMGLTPLADKQSTEQKISGAVSHLLYGWVTALVFGGLSRGK